MFMPPNPHSLNRAHAHLCALLSLVVCHLLLLYSSSTYAGIMSCYLLSSVDNLFILAIEMREGRRNAGRIMRWEWGATKSVQNHVG